MCEVKYEAVFGDQSLFDGVSDYTVMVIRQPGDNMPWCFKSFDEGFEYVSQGDRNPEVAIRRIIKTPAWTVADKKAGRLPEIGARYLYQHAKFTCHYVDDVGDVWGHSDDGGVLCRSIDEIEPLETPEERAQRLRDEWIDSSLQKIKRRNWTDAQTFSQIKEFIGDVYDALLSGELQVPTQE